MSTNGRPSKGDFFTKLAGVSFDGRQEDLARYRFVGGILDLVPENNEHDPYACSVLWLEENAHGDTVRKTHLGFIPKRYSKTATMLIARGCDLRVDCEVVTGGEDGQLLGMNIALYSPDEDVRPYFFGKWGGDPKSYTVPLWD